MTHGQGLVDTTCLFTSSNLGNSESWRAEYYCWLTTSLEHDKRVERSFNFSSCSRSILFHYAQKNSMMFGSCNCLNTLSTTSFCYQPINSLCIFTWSWYTVVDHMLLVCCNSAPPCVSLSHHSCRPVEGERCVPPDALCSYRETHKFLRPCCLCPLLRMERGIKHDRFVEAAIHIPLFGCYAKEYVAECTGSQCGYLGLFISLDRRESLMLDLSSATRENVQPDWGPCQEIPSERFVAKFLLAFMHESA